MFLSTRSESERAEPLANKAALAFDGRNGPIGPDEAARAAVASDAILFIFPRFHETIANIDFLALLHFTPWAVMINKDKGPHLQLYGPFTSFCTLSFIGTLQIYLTQPFRSK